ncbi:MAG: hypothetical protein Q8Q31_05140 [Nanoarchaeota archaeon]|nr:hypothetical protein [Nanoarchaeota archaeon]
MSINHISNKGYAKRDINQAGRDIIHNHYQARKDKKLLLQPLGPDNDILETAERYWNFVNRDERRLVLFFFFPLVMSIFLGQDFFGSKLFSNFYISAAGIAVFIVLLSVIIMKSTNTCPNCNAGFATYEIRRELLNRKRIADEVVTNIETTRKCRKCKYVYNTQIVNKEMKS